VSLRDQLLDIRERHGRLVPDLVVQEAESVDHPLHDRFEWDDTVAGPAYRRVQAHELIRSVRVVYRPADDVSGERTVRAFHAVRGESGAYVYETAEGVVRDPVAATVLLRDMEREWQALKRRFEQFAEFREMVRRDLDDGEAA